MQSNYGIDSVDLAIYEEVHSYVDPVTGQKGVAPLANRIGMNEGTLQNKVNVKNNTHHLNTDELDKVILTTHGFSILHALNTKYNHVAIKLESFDGVSDLDLINCLLNVDIENGDFRSAIKIAFEDGDLTYSEYDEIEIEAFDVIRAILVSLQRLKSMRTNKVVMLDVEDLESE
jgi:hypothetical protein